MTCQQKPCFENMFLPNDAKTWICRFGIGMLAAETFDSAYGPMQGLVVCFICFPPCPLPILQTPTRSLNATPFQLLFELLELNISDSLCPLVSWPYWSPDKPDITWLYSILQTGHNLRYFLWGIFRIEITKSRKPYLRTHYQQSGWLLKMPICLVTVGPVPYVFPCPGSASVGHMKFQVIFSSPPKKKKLHLAVSCSRQTFSKKHAQPFLDQEHLLSLEMLMQCHWVWLQTGHPPTQCADNYRLINPQ